MKIHPLYQHNPLENFSYIIELEDNRAILVDPFDGDLCYEYMQEHNLQAIAIIITHEHLDHFAGVEAFQKKSGVSELYFWEIAAREIPYTETKFLEDGVVIYTENDWEIVPVFTPWHTFGHMTLEIKQKWEVKYLLTADMLFAGGVGNVRSWSIEYLYTSIQKFHKYADSVKVYSGHNYIENNLNFTLSVDPENIIAQEVLKKCQGTYYFTTMWEEKLINLFLRLDDKNLRKVLFEDKKVTDEEVFAELRKRRNQW